MLLMSVVSSWCTQAHVTSAINHSWFRPVGWLEPFFPLVASALLLTPLVISYTDISA